MILSKIQLLGLRALWFSASIISYTWFLFWICYDVLVWGVELTHVSPANYVGLILSIAFIGLNTKLGKIILSKRLKLPVKQKAQKKLILKAKKQKPQKKLLLKAKKTQVQQVQQVPEKKLIQPLKQKQQIQPVKEEEKQIPQGASIPPGCSFYLGYLHKRPKSVEMPEKCLDCDYVVNCLSP